MITSLSHIPSHISGLVVNHFQLGFPCPSMTGEISGGTVGLQTRQVLLEDIKTEQWIKAENDYLGSLMSAQSP